MKHFYQFILEKTGDDRAFLRTIFKKQCNKLYPDIVLKNSSVATNEIYRADFADNINAVKSMIENIFSDIDFNIIGDPEIFGRSNGASSKYLSYKIEYNGDFYYITNTVSEKSIYKSKDLTPDKLGLTEQSVYTSIDSYIKTVKEKIDVFIKDDNVNKALTYLIDVIKTGKLKTTGVFNSKGCDDFFMSGEEGTVEIDIDNAQFNNVLKGDIANIEKDFGEVIGPELFLRLFKNTEISFPTKSNEPLVDYKVNGYSVSAKQYGGGSIPSGALLMKQSKTLLDKASDKLDNFSKKDKRIIFTDEEKDFIDKVAPTFDMSIFNQQKTLISEFVLSSNKLISKHIGFNINDCTTYNELADQLDIVLSKENKQRWFTKFYQLCKYTPKDWSPEIIDKRYNQLSNTIKWGILFYPLYKMSIDRLNELYATGDNNILSSVLRKTLDIKQIYFGIKQSELKLKIIASSSAKYMFKTGGMSTSNINNSKLSIKMM